MPQYQRNKFILDKKLNSQNHYNRDPKVIWTAVSLDIIYVADL